MGQRAAQGEWLNQFVIDYFFLDKWVAQVLTGFVNKKRKFQIQGLNLKIIQELSMTQYRACSSLNLKNISWQDSVPMASNQSIM